MKLWLLRPVGGLPTKENPWEPWYDKAFDFVVRAKDEEHARLFAHENGGGENNSGRYGEGLCSPWFDARFSTCTVLTAAGERGVIIQDYHAA